MGRKLRAKDIEEDDEIDFDTPNNATSPARDLNEQMIRNLDSSDEKLRELSCTCLANISSHMEPEFYEKLITKDILKKLTDRVTDPYSQIAYNALSAIERLTSLNRVHNKVTDMEKYFKESMFIEMLKTQVDSICSKIKAALGERIEKKQDIRKLE